MFKTENVGQLVMQNFAIQAASPGCGCAAEAVLSGVDPVLCAGKLASQFEGGLHFLDRGIQSGAAFLEGVQPGEGWLPLRLVVALRELGSIRIEPAAGTQRMKSLGMGHNIQRERPRTDAL